MEEVWAKFSLSQMNPKGQNIWIGMFLIMLLFNKYVLYDELLYQQIYHPLIYVDWIPFISHI